ncbi:hypothetical protein ETH_00042475 [Eimeria tenella]|uniref:Uncharacterized protein n=1 Tax=Eimeria tenella TaxID=5802 RepID=U6L5N2_EIMTE|nr:hypothetical protein ETH_00042475 [Eimeria tenella]CDJ44493.1 hypothetical protein ETH_00042475 [Eimeria tenella]|eukprot:XP_013235242.1 hypothetical protein ETH_00042475 [Eimeria tenella]
MQRMQQQSKCKDLLLPDLALQQTLEKPRPPAARGGLGLVSLAARSSSSSSSSSSRGESSRCGQSGTSKERLHE